MKYVGMRIDHDQYVFEYELASGQRYRAGVTFEWLAYHALKANMEGVARVEADRRISKAHGEEVECTM